MAPTVKEIRNAQRAQGPATVLGIGTAVPPNIFYQKDYPDFYFRVTNSEHMTELKEKFKRVCEKSTVEKRHFHLTEDLLNDNPSLRGYMQPSLDARHDIVVAAIPKLAEEAALKAMKDWGQDKSKITHFIMRTTSWGADIPGPEYQVSKLLGLHPSVKLFMMYQQGCFGGGTILRLAKDVAENNRGSRVLAVCAEITATWFRGPSDIHVDSMMAQALYGDGAGAVIIGADPDLSIERPIFELVWTAQTYLPDSDGAIVGRVREAGVTIQHLKDVPAIISKNIDKAIVEAFSPLGISDWNELFWVIHPCGPVILDQIEQKLALKPQKMEAAREILKNYGNMWTAGVFFVMDEMRKKSLENGNSTTGEGLDWGVFFGFGPGVTVETVVLHSVPVVN